MKKEEKLRQEKLKNLEKYGTVLGKSSKTIAAETNIDENAAAIKRKTEKAKFKPGRCNTTKYIAAYM